MNNVQSHQWLGVVGGAILIVVGVVTYRHKIDVDPGTSEVVPKNEPHFMVYITKGFLLNIANPFVWLFWPTVVLGVAAPFMDTTSDIILFFAGTLSVVFLSDVTKVYLASKIKRFITGKFLMKINAVAGIALVVFGIVLIIRSLTV
jgi:threonine/homoserine/homoserine lactone efflux protein